MTVLRRFTACASLLAFATLHAAAADVPVSVQLALFANVWKLDRNFQPVGPVRIAILYQESNAASVAMKNSVVSWIGGPPGGYEAVPVAVDDAEGAASLEKVNANVFYVTRMRGADIQRIAATARARRIRTMTGAPEYVRLGLSVGIGVRNDRPLILINLDAARAEGAAYQAQLLRLAEIVHE